MPTNGIPRHPMSRTENVRQAGRPPRSPRAAVARWRWTVPGAGLARPSWRSSACPVWLHNSNTVVYGDSQSKNRNIDKLSLPFETQHSASAAAPQYAMNLGKEFEVDDEEEESVGGASRSGEQSSATAAQQQSSASAAVSASCAAQLEIMQANRAGVVQLVENKKQGKVLPTSVHIRFNSNYA